MTTNSTITRENFSKFTHERLDLTDQLVTTNGRVFSKWNIFLRLWYRNDLDAVKVAQQIHSYVLSNKGSLKRGSSCLRDNLTKLQFRLHTNPKRTAEIDKLFQEMSDALDIPGRFEDDPISRPNSTSMSPKTENELSVVAGEDQPSGTVPPVLSLHHVDAGKGKHNNKVRPFGGVPVLTFLQ